MKARKREKLSNLEKAVLASSLLQHQESEKAYNSFSKFGFYLLQDICIEVSGKKPLCTLEAYFRLKEKKLKEKAALNDFERDAFKYFTDYYDCHATSKETLKALVCAYFISPETEFQGSYQETLLAAIRRRYARIFKNAILFAGIASLTYYLTALL